MSDGKDKIAYTKNMLIKDISKECFSDKRVVKRIYDYIEAKIFKLLSSADEDTDVVVRLFDGISIRGEVQPEKTKVSNLTGEEIVVKSKLKPKAHITRRYCEKLNDAR